VLAREILPPAEVLASVNVPVGVGAGVAGFGLSSRDTGVRPEVLRRLGLVDALTTVFRDDAMLSLYVPQGEVPSWPRINKDGVARYGQPLFVHAFLCDVDTVPHLPWTDEGFEEALALVERAPAVATAGYYFTQKGYRIVQPLARPIALLDAEPHIERWLEELIASGIPADTKCKNWNRKFRLPHTPKEPDGRARLMDLSRMRAVELAPLASVGRARSGPCGTRSHAESSRSPPTPVWKDTLPSMLGRIVEPLARVIATVDSEWHSLFLALAGALLSRGVDAATVPALCRAISVATGRDTKTDDREAAARTTVLRHREGLEHTGYGRLARDWPAVADVFDDLFASDSERRLRDALAAPVPEAASTAAEASAAVLEALRQAPDGLTVIQAACGLGKTRAAEQVAAERAQRPYATKDAAGLRAPPHSKTAISVDKHALAQQIVRHLPVLGAEGAWHFGPLGVRTESGERLCKYAGVAEHLVAGGQPMQWLLCKGRDIHPCEHFATCTAKDGYEGPANARVHVGPHALAGTLSAEAGPSGLLVMDEPPSPLETQTFTKRDFAQAVDELTAFEGNYIAALRPLLEAVATWACTGSVTGHATTLESVAEAYAYAGEPFLADARRFSDAEPEADMIACAKAARLPAGAPPVPPLRAEALARARKSAKAAAKIGAASRVLRMLHHAASSEVPVSLRLDERGRGQVLHVTRANQVMFEALRRDGSVVVLDANADLWLPVYEKIVGYRPPVHRFDAPDGAPIERTVLRMSKATRKSWLPAGKLLIAPSLKSAIRSTLAWARERPGNGTLAIIAWMTLEIALRAAMNPTDATLEKAWIDAGQDLPTLRAFREEFSADLQGWEGKILFGHYGALRGLDEMAEADCIVTLGDPWANVEQIRHDTEFLGLRNWEERLEAMCRAELEQAHGRLRTIHRTRPGRALHVGTVAPGGAGWAAGRAKVLTPAKLAAASGVMSAEEFARAVDVLGGVRATATALGCAPSQVSRYASGARAVPSELAARLRALVANAGKERASDPRPPRGESAEC
jgi:hypothetical protein